MFHTLSQVKAIHYYSRFNSWYDWTSHLDYRPTQFNAATNYFTVYKDHL